MEKQIRAGCEMTCFITLLQFTLPDIRSFGCWILFLVHSRSAFVRTLCITNYMDSSFPRISEKYENCEILIAHFSDESTIVTDGSTVSWTLIHCVQRTYTRIIIYFTFFSYVLCTRINEISISRANI